MLDLNGRRIIIVRVVRTWVRPGWSWWWLTIIFIISIVVVGDCEVVGGGVGPGGEGSQPVDLTVQEVGVVFSRLVG